MLRQEPCCNRGGLIVFIGFGVFFSGGMGEEPGFLIVDELNGGIVNIVDGFERRVCGRHCRCRSRVGS